MVQVMMTSMSVQSLWPQKVPQSAFPSDNLVFSSSGVLFQAVSCDLVGKIREAVPVSETAIDPLRLQVSRN